MFAFCLSLSRNVLLAGSIRWEVVFDDGALRDEEEEKDIEKGLDCVRSESTSHLINLCLFHI